MQTRFIVLGCGMIGTTMARDLSEESDFQVAVADINEKNLQAVRESANVETHAVDFSDVEALRSVVADFDIVLGALPSSIGLQSMRAIIEAGKHYADITFMREDARQLDELAKQNGCTVAFDCGVAPGLSNMIVGYAASQLDTPEEARIYVGGLPKARCWPFQYKAPFAPGDVIEEYTRLARFVQNSEIVTKPALTDPELMDFPNVGSLEAFNTDGLRSLMHTMKIPNMIEKTLRYPGHIELMRVFRETGLFGTEEIEVEGVRVKPLDLVKKLMFPMWKLEPEEDEFTVMRASVSGQKDGNPITYTYDLYDEFDAKTKTTSMARTTAFPCTSVARMIAEKQLAEPGVWAPELIAQQKGVFDHILEDLHKRGVSFQQRTQAD